MNIIVLLSSDNFTIPECIPLIDPLMENSSGDKLSASIFSPDFKIIFVLNETRVELSLGDIYIKDWEKMKLFEKNKMVASNR
jgi:hypothetical protein